MYKTILSALALLTGLSLATPAAAAAKQDLIVSAAASLTNAFRDLGRDFERTHPGTQITFNFAASGPLLQQIAQGAPVDVFASADEPTMDRAQQQGLILPKTRVDFVGNKLVLIEPADSRRRFRSLTDLTRPEVKRIAIGNPASVPNGHYAQEALQAAGLWTTLSPKFIYAQSVRQSLDYVDRGEVDAGFVFATDAAIDRGKVKVAMDVPLRRPIVYPIAVVKRSHDPALARTFIDFVRSPVGQGVLARYGFAKP